MKMRSAFLQLLRDEERKEINDDMKRHICSFLSRHHPNSHKVNVYCCRLLLNNRHSICDVQLFPHSRFTVEILYKLYSLQLNCTYSNYTEAAVTCSAAQQHSTFTVQIRYNCTACNWTVLTVITQKLPLHVQLHNNTFTYKYCTNSTVCNWTVLTVITLKLPLNVQLHNSTQTVRLMSSEVQYTRLF